MKKIILSLMLFAPLCAIGSEVISVNGVDEPQWKDFVPPAFANVSEPKGLGKFNDTATYWYKRRVDFESGIEKCRAIEDNDSKFSCYQDLKVKQYQKNSDYNARLEAMERVKLGPQEMIDRTTDMIPLGGLTNMMRFQPNEFR